MLGDNLKNLRKSHKLTLQALADSLNAKYPNTFNFNKGRISKWENNIDEPSLATAKILADYFDISIDFLYYGYDFLNKKSDSEQNETYFAIQRKSKKLNKNEQQQLLDYMKKNFDDIDNGDFDEDDEDDL